MEEGPYRFLYTRPDRWCRPGTANPHDGQQVGRSQSTTSLDVYSQASLRPGSVLTIPSSIPYIALIERLNRVRR